MSKKKGIDDLLANLPESLINILKQEIKDTVKKINDSTKEKKEKTPREIPVIRLLAFFVTSSKMPEDTTEALVDKLSDYLLGGDREAPNIDVDVACLSAGEITGIAVKILALKVNTASVLAAFSAAVTEFDDVLDLEMIDMCTGNAVRIDDLADNNIDDEEDSSSESSDTDEESDDEEDSDGDWWL